MPTVLRIGGYRFYFYSHEPHEPLHIRIDRDNLSANTNSHALTGQIEKYILTIHSSGCSYRTFTPYPFPFDPISTQVSRY